MPHKYQATIDLMKNVIHKLPCVFPSSRHQEMEAVVFGFERNADTKMEEIEKKIIEFGSEIWPYSEAHEAFHKIYGALKEKKLMREKLSPSAKKELDKYIAQGGDIEKMRAGDKFETFFSAEIKAEMIDAELVAHDAVHKEMEELLAGPKRADFDALLRNYQEKFLAISKKIDELEVLSKKSPQWSAEILDKVKMFREGFAYVERPPTLDDVSREIEYYIDIMEV